MTDGSGGVTASAGVGPLPIRIRLETPGDEPGVRRVHEAAFPGPEEADIVDAIRAGAPDGWQSLVAVDAAGEIVGHLLLSPCAVEDGEGRVVATVLALGPIGVVPPLQYRGVGAALMAAAQGLAVARAVPAIVLLGYPSYYPRFGYLPACAMGLLPPADAWPDEAWMARLLPAWDDAMAGTVRYPEAFGPLV